MIGFSTTTKLMNEIILEIAPHFTNEKNIIKGIKSKKGVFSLLLLKSKKKFDKILSERIVFRIHNFCLITRIDFLIGVLAIN